MKMAQCGRTFDHEPHGGPTATRDASCDGVLREPQPRCVDCGCLVSMHFSDGCHNANGFICKCPRTFE